MLCVYVYVIGFFLGHCGNLRIMAWVQIKAILDLHLSPSQLSACHNLQRERETKGQEARKRETYFLLTIQRTKKLLLLYFSRYLIDMLIEN